MRSVTAWRGAQDVLIVDRMLDSLNWYKAWSIIADYGNNGGKYPNQTAEKLSLYFADNGYDLGISALAGYFPAISPITPSDTDSIELIQANLVCQWAVSKGFHPLGFNALWSNYNNKKRSNLRDRCVKPFKDVIANPYPLEDLTVYKGVIFTSLQVRSPNTKGEIIILLEALGWEKAVTIISKYGNKRRGQRKRARRALIDYFIPGKPISMQ